MSKLGLIESIRTSHGYQKLMSRLTYNAKKAKYYLLIPKSHLIRHVVNNFCYTRRLMFRMLGEEMQVPFVWEYMSHALSHVINHEAKPKYENWLSHVNEFRFEYILAILQHHCEIGNTTTMSWSNGQIVFSSQLASISGSTTTTSDIDVTLFKDVLNDIYTSHIALFGESSIELMFDINFYLCNFEYPLSVLTPSMMDMFPLRYMFQNQEYALVVNKPDECSMMFSLRRLCLALGITFDEGTFNTISKKSSMHIRNNISLATLLTRDQYHTCSTYKHVIIQMMRKIPIKLSKEEYLESIYENIGFFAYHILHAPCYTELFAVIIKSLKYLYRAYDAAVKYLIYDRSTERLKYVQHRRYMFEIMEMVRTGIFSFDHYRVIEISKIDKNIHRLLKVIRTSMSGHGGAILTSLTLHELFDQQCFAKDAYERIIPRTLVVYILKDLYINCDIPFPVSVSHVATGKTLIKNRTTTSIIPGYSHIVCCFQPCITDIDHHTLVPDT